MRTTHLFFRGKPIGQDHFVYGYYIPDYKNYGPVIIDKDTELIPVQKETLGQCIGQVHKGRKIFEGDIFFEEIEGDEGDRRLYVVTTWIEEKSMFSFLTSEEYIGYEHYGVGALDETMPYEFDNESMKRYHYAGNIYDNRDLLEK